MNRPSFLTTFLLLAIGLCPAPADAAILIVLDGVNEVPKEFPTIQAALDASLNGDVVKVSPGVYHENLDFGDKSVELVSAEGPEATVIDADGGKIAVFSPAAPVNTGIVFGARSPTQVCSITGFTIRNAAADESGAISIGTYSKLRLTGNIFEDNCTESAVFGPVIRIVDAGAATIDANVFRGNGCESIESSSVIQANAINSFFIRNNEFFDNPCAAIGVEQPIGLSIDPFGSGYFAIVNNTFVRNRTGVALDGLQQIIMGFGWPQSYISAVIFRNNLIYQNGTGLVSYRELQGFGAWDHNLVYGNGVDYSGTESLTGLDGNISADPLLADEANNDFRLTRQSPALEAGSNVNAPDVDFEGESRPNDADGDDIAVTDIGMDEFHGGLRLLVEGGFLQESTSPAGTGVTVTLKPIPSTRPLASLQIYLNGQPVADTSPATVVLPLGESMLDAIATTSDGVMLDAAHRITIVDTTPPVIHARFVNRKTGAEIQSISSRKLSKVEVKIDLEDNGDPEPHYDSVLGIPVRDGQKIDYRGSKKAMTLNVEEMTLKVTATDASGNVSTLSRQLTVEIEAPTWNDFIGGHSITWFRGR